MSPVKVLCVLLLAGTILHPLTAQDPDPQAATNAKEQAIIDATNVAKAKSDEIRDQLLGGIEVNGKKLTPKELKRETVFLTGTNLIELKILEFILEEWKERLIKDEGKKPEDFVVKDETIIKELKDNLKEFAIKYPGLDFWEVVRSQTGISKNSYIHQRRVTAMFDKVFMPGPADQWPEITAEAVKAGSNGTDGEAFWEGLKKNGRDDKGKAREMPVFWNGMIRKLLVTQLKKWSDIKYPADGLPPEVALEVNGRKWNTDDAFEQVKEGLFVQDMSTAVSELVVREVLKQELIRNSAYIGDKEFRESFKDYRKQFDSTLFNTEMIARAFKGYPTLQAFRTRWRLMKSYENMISKEVNDDVLQAHADQHKRFFSDGSVNVDVITFMGKDQRSGVWVPDGMAQAKMRAEACLAMIEKGEKTFDQALDARGEYFTIDKERGRLGNKSLNELRRTLGESEYTDILHGFSLGYFIYYTAEPGKVIGPIRGPHSWFITRVNSRTPAKSEVSVKDERTRELIKQDFLTHRFFEWSKQVMAKADIK